MPQRTRPQSDGHFEETTQFMLMMDARRFTVFLDRESRDAPDGVVVGVIPGMRGINLSRLTVEELDAFEKFWTEAIALARPQCEALDAAAQTALETGDRSLKRLYRITPQFIDLRPDKETPT